MVELILRPIFESNLLLVLVAIALVGLLCFGPAKSKTTPWRRRTLVGLRVLVIAVLLFAMLRPTLIRTEIKYNSATLVILADKSRSMQMRDLAGSKPRWQGLLERLQESSPSLKELGQKLEIKLYTFDKDVQSHTWDPNKLGLPETPDGEESAIGAALEEVLRRETGKRLAAVILLSDGAQRALPSRDVPPQAPAGRLADMGVPLYTVALGQARGLGQTGDVAVSELSVGATVFVNTRLDVTGLVRIDSMLGKTVNVELLFETKPGEMEVVDRTVIEADKHAMQQTVDLKYLPQIPGEYKVTLRAEPLHGELITTNNELSTFITVLKGGVNALYVEGTPRMEQKFLRWSLGSARNINVDFYSIDAQRPNTMPPEASTWFEPGKYDVYIFGDIDAKAFSDKQLKQLAEAVDRGAGLVMLGGFHSFGPGHYRDTALVDVLPLLMEREESQTFEDKVIIRAWHLDGPRQMLPTSAGERHFVMLLGDRSTNKQFWEQLPKLEGANRFRGVKRSAQVLAETPAGEPLLLAQDYGAGRVMAFAGDSTWRWWLGGHSREHRRFWRQVVLWLAHKDESSDNDVWVKLDRRRYQPGQRVEFSAGAQTPEGDIVEDATFTASVVLPDESRQPVQLLRKTLDMGGTFFDTQQPGDYLVMVSAKRGDELLGTARARFLVHQQDLELDNPAADPGLLASLSAVTEGKSLAPEQLPGTLARLKDQPLNLEVEIQSRTELWGESPWNWLICLSFAGLLCVEWFLRKRWSLV